MATNVIMLVLLFFIVFNVSKSSSLKENARTPRFHTMRTSISDCSAYDKIYFNQSIITDTDYSMATITVTSSGVNLYTLTLRGYRDRGGGVGVPSELNTVDENLCESGLGLYDDIGQDSEIDKSHFIQIDFTSMRTALQNIPNAQFPADVTIGSAQYWNKEGYMLYGSNTAGTLGTLVVNGTLGNTCLPKAPIVDLRTGYNFYGVQAAGLNRYANVFLTSLKVTCQPFDQLNPSSFPTVHPVSLPTLPPNSAPLMKPSTFPISFSSDTPSSMPSILPNQSSSPTALPSTVQSIIPNQSSSPSVAPSIIPSAFPGLAPSLVPITQPSIAPSQSSPSTSPSLASSVVPSNKPSITPNQSSYPSDVPSAMPSITPKQSSYPSVSPSTVPSIIPNQSSYPSVSPSTVPSIVPNQSSPPSVAPSTVTSIIPSQSSSPSSLWTRDPTSVSALLICLQTQKNCCMILQQHNRCPI